MLDTPLGQLIIAAAVLDDVVALLLLTLLMALGAGRSPLELLIPFSASFGLMVCLTRTNT